MKDTPIYAGLTTTMFFFWILVHLPTDGLFIPNQAPSPGPMIACVNYLSPCQTCYTIPDNQHTCGYRPLTRCRKLRIVHAPGILGTFFTGHRPKRKPLASDPDVHHGTCVTHVPWCMSGSLNGGGGENVPGIPGACATRNFAYLVRGLWQFFSSAFYRDVTNHMFVSREEIPNVTISYWPVFMRKI